MVERSGSVTVDAIDFSELRARHSRAQLRDFTRWAKATQDRPHRTREFLRSTVVALIVGFSLLLLVSVSLLIGVVLIGIALVGSIDWAAALVIGALMSAFIGLSGVRLVDIWRRDVRFRVGWRRWMGMYSFTDSNNMVYIPEILSPAYPGSVFTIGQVRRASDVVATTAGRFVEIGNYQYSGQTYLNRSVNRCGYIRVELDRPVPHLYLRSRRSRKFGATFARSQEFSLEGDFGKHFRLYSPGGYERDALYILTPDLMAVLIDQAADFDVEFVGSSIYFYSPREFRMRDPRTYLRSIQLVDSVVVRVLKQTRFYSDFRTAGQHIGARGARLSRGVTVAGVICIVIAVAQVFRLAFLFVR